MNVQDALAQIAEIRQRMALTVTFRGYRSGTTALTGIIAIAAGAIQAWSQPVDSFDIHDFLSIWCSAAIAGILIVGTGFLLRRGEYTDGHHAGAMTIAAVESFLPCLVAGALVTYALAFFQSFNSIGLLPGLWMILFSLGIFASRRLLPRAIFAAAGYYMLCGLVVLTLRPTQAFSPWTMASVFGIGQFLTAGILYFTLERPASIDCPDNVPWREPLRGSNRRPTVDSSRSTPCGAEAPPAAQSAALQSSSIAGDQHARNDSGEPS